uniref:Uncharacterized protein n=1 Tax=Knipowitschia caucasica TaxID=637954 RepID=A0AAV2KTK8_KNICA
MVLYSQDFLLNRRGSNVPLSDILTDTLSSVGIYSDPKDYCEIKNDKPWKRGSRGGVRRRLKRLGFRRTPLPSIILRNAQSIRNKMDELHANVVHQEKFKNACILAFSETWITSADSEMDLSLPGFGAPIRLDRDPDVTGKSQEGGVCFFINQRWCNNFTVKESLCTEDIELLSISVRLCSDCHPPDPEMD